MDDGTPPRTPHRGGASGAAADVLVSGSDAPRRSGRRASLALGLAAVVVAVGLVLVQPVRDGPLPASDLRWVETGGGATVAWGYAGRLEVSLPLLLQNDGAPVTVGSVGMASSSLVHPAMDVDLARGGRLPLTLQRSMDCPSSARVPGSAVVWVTVRTGERTERRRLLLPDRLRDTLADALARECRHVPLDQAVILSARAQPPRDGAVLVRVEARNVREQDVRLRSVEAATGLRVVVVPDAAATAAVPVRLGKRPHVLRLRVQVEDCARLVPADSAGRIAVADVGYEDGSGAAAVEAVLDASGAVQALVDAAC